MIWQQNGNVVHVCRRTVSPRQQSPQHDDPRYVKQYPATNKAQALALFPSQWRVSVRGTAQQWVRGLSATRSLKGWQWWSFGNSSSQTTRKRGKRTPVAKSSDAFCILRQPSTLWKMVYALRMCTRSITIHVFSCLIFCVATLGHTRARKSRFCWIAPKPSVPVSLLPPLRVFMQHMFYQCP